MGEYRENIKDDLLFKLSSPCLGTGRSLTMHHLADLTAKSVLRMTPKVLGNRSDYNIASYSTFTIYRIPIADLSLL